MKTPMKNQVLSDEQIEAVCHSFTERDVTTPAKYRRTAMIRAVIAAHEAELAKLEKPVATVLQVARHPDGTKSLIAKCEEILLPGDVLYTHPSHSDAVALLREMRDSLMSVLAWTDKIDAVLAGQEQPGVTEGWKLNRPDVVSYVSRYGGMCRDCADENGVCPNSGLTCASDKGIKHVLSALDYGLKHGYLTPQLTQEKTK